MGIAAVSFAAASLVAAPARASDMGMVMPMLFCPVNLVAAMLVAPLGIPTRGRRPGMLGNLFVGLIAFFVGLPGFLMACISLSYVSHDYSDMAFGNLATYAIFLAALTFAIRSRSRQLEASLVED